MNLTSLETIANNIVATEETAKNIDLSNIRKSCLAKHNEAADIYKSVCEFLSKVIPSLVKRADDEKAWTPIGASWEHKWKNPYNSIIKYLVEDESGNTTELAYWVDGILGVKYWPNENPHFVPYVANCSDGWEHYHYVRGLEGLGLGSLRYKMEVWNAAFGDLCDRNVRGTVKAVDNDLAIMKALLNRVTKFLKFIADETTKRVEDIDRLDSNTGNYRKTTIKFEVYS